MSDIKQFVFGDKNNVYFNTSVGINFYFLHFTIICVHLLTSIKPECSISRRTYVFIFLNKVKVLVEKIGIQ